VDDPRAMAKRRAKDDFAGFVRGARRETLEAALIDIGASSPELQEQLAERFRAAVAPPPKRVADDAELRVGGTGAFDRLGVDAMTLVLAGLEPWERLGALGACKGWLALRGAPNTWTSLSFRSRAATHDVTGQRDRSPAVNERCLRKLFTGPRRTFSDAALSTVTSLEVRCQTWTNSKKDTISAAGWSVILDALPALTDISIHGKVFRSQFYRKVAKRFGAQLTSFSFFVVTDHHLDMDLLCSVLEKTPRLLALEVQVPGSYTVTDSLAPIRRISQQLASARGAESPLLEKLNFWRGPTFDGNVFANALGRLFPELITLEISQMFTTPTHVHNASSVIQKAFPDVATAPMARLTTLKVGFDITASRAGWDTIAERATRFATLLSTACPRLETLEYSPEWIKQCETFPLVPSVAFVFALKTSPLPFLRSLTINVSSYLVVSQRLQSLVDFPRTQADINSSISYIFKLAPSTLQTFALKGARVSSSQGPAEETVAQTLVERLRAESGLAAALPKKSLSYDLTHLDFATDEVHFRERMYAIN
jgi:hypothetical protein